MGTRSTCYIAIRAGIALTPAAKALLGPDSAHPLEHDGARAWVFERNVAPLHARFGCGGEGAHIADLRAEMALIEWLTTVPIDAFRWVRSGEETDAAGRWFDHPFVADAQVAAIEREFLMQTSPEPEDTSPAPRDLTHSQGLADALRALLDAVNYDEDGNAIIYRTSAQLEDEDSDVAPVTEAAAALASYAQVAIADPRVRARNDYDDAVARLRALDAEVPADAMREALHEIEARTRIDSDTRELALEALSDIRSLARRAHQL